LHTAYGKAICLFHQGKYNGYPIDSNHPRKTWTIDLKNGEARNGYIVTERLRDYHFVDGCKLSFEFLRLRPRYVLDLLENHEPHCVYPSNYFAFKSALSIFSDFETSS